MIRPKMKNSGYSTAQLPEFRGGVNVSDAETSIKDNQLASARNMVYEEERFETRSGFKSLDGIIDTAYVNHEEVNSKIPWDRVNSRTHLLPAEHVINEEYKYIDGAWATTNNEPLHIKGIYIAHNSFCNVWQKNEGYSNHVFGNINSWLITDDGKRIQVYLTQDISDEALNPGYLSFNYYRTRYMTYSGKPVAENGLGLFLYICGRYWGSKSAQKFRLYELKHIKDSEYKNSSQLKTDDIHYTWVELTENDFYVPTVLVNGKGNSYASLPANESTEYSPQSMWESFNLMTPKFKAYFTTDGGNYTDSEGFKTWKGSHSFTIPWGIARKKQGNSWVLENDFKITYTDNDGNENVLIIPAGGAGSEITPEFHAPGYSDNDDYAGAVRASVTLDSQKATVHFYYGPQYIVNFSANDRFILPRGIANNLLFEGVAADRGGIQIIGDMGGLEWFGGSGEGLSGGTRLFLYGGEYEPNRLMWSDVDNPLYFPENNNVYIGDQSDGITKIAKQNNMLVIFKKYSTHYTTYVDNSTNLSTADVLNNLVSDISAITAIFPVTQISGEIGCDIPSSLQLCDNNLVWCNSNGKIYVLKTANQYSENNIYELSYPVFPLIKEKIRELKSYKVDGNGLYIVGFNKGFINRNCFAADFDGMYWLNIGDMVFTMKYRDSGFKYAYSYREGNAVKQSIGYDVISFAGGISKTVETAHIAFKRLSEDKQYTNEALKSVKSSDYTFETLKAMIYYKTAGFIKTSNGLLLVRESKGTFWNRANSAYRTAELLEFVKDSHNDSNLRDVESAGNNTATVKGFEVEHGDPYDSPITADFCTKSYDFGGTSSKKRIEHIYFDVFPKVDSMITVVANTEKGRELLKMIPVYKVESAKSEHIRCNLHGVRRLALEISVSGTVAIGGFQIKYKDLGR